MFYDILEKTFTEFLKSSEKIATNMLANRLDLLTKNSLLKFMKFQNSIYFKTPTIALVKFSVLLGPIFTVCARSGTTDT